MKRKREKCPGWHEPIRIQVGQERMKGIIALLERIMVRCDENLRILQGEVPTAYFDKRLESLAWRDHSDATDAWNKATSAWREATRLEVALCKECRRRRSSSGLTHNVIRYPSTGSSRYSWPSKEERQRFRPIQGTPDSEEELP